MNWNFFSVFWCFFILLCLLMLLLLILFLIVVVIALVIVVFFIIVYNSLSLNKKKSAKTKATKSVFLIQTISWQTNAHVIIKWSPFFSLSQRHHSCCCRLICFGSWKVFCLNFFWGFSSFLICLVKKLTNYKRGREGNL